MSSSKNDPIGKAIQDFQSSGINKDILVHSDISEDDVIPSKYLFRSAEEMPIIERTALLHCQGEVLDIGAAAGPHAIALRSHGLSVDCLEKSPGACAYLNTKDFKVYQQDFLSFSDKQYDTLLLLMNGLGIAETLGELPLFLEHAKTLLKPGGRIICDSSDVKYVYEDDEGGMWVDLANEYYGNFKFQMEYEDQISDWFNWLYVDFQNLQEICSRLALKVTKLAEENEHYLVQIEHES